MIRLHLILLNVVSCLRILSYSSLDLCIMLCALPPLMSCSLAPNSTMMSCTVHSPTDSLVQPSCTLVYIVCNPAPRGSPFKLSLGLRSKLLSPTLSPSSQSSCVCWFLVLWPWVATPIPYIVLPESIIHSLDTCMSSDRGIMKVHDKQLVLFIHVINDIDRLNSCWIQEYLILIIVA